jgi:hypothetical protein
VSPDERAVPPEDPPEDAQVRRLLRGLPEVDPPPGFFDDLIRRRRRRARTVAAAAFALAVVAGGFVVAEATGITGEVDPSLMELADRHGRVLTVDTATVAEQVEGEALPAPYQAPPQLGRMQRGMAVWHDDDVVQVIYVEDGDTISVFEQAGDLDDLPAGLHRIDVEGVRAWSDDDGGMIVVRRHDVVYVVVGDLDPDALPEVLADLPDARPMGMAERVRDAMEDLVSAFGLN